MFDKLKIPLKHRHLLTRSGNIRLKFVAVIVLVALALVSTWMIWPQSDNQHQDILVQVQEDPSDKGLLDDVKDIVSHKIISVGDYDPEDSGLGITPFLSRIGVRPVFDKPYEWTQTLTVKSGDSLGVLMEQTGLSGEEYFAAMKALKSKVDARDIRPGQTINVTHITHEGVDKVVALAYVFNSLKSVEVKSYGPANWSAEAKERPVALKIHAAKATIDNSLYADLGAQGVPDGIINRMITAYSWTVDFQRDIWGGEEVEVLYETKETDDGSYVRSNRLLFANMKLRNKELPIYLFEKKDGSVNYFEPNGQSIRRALMKTPIDGGRLSSGFGKRKHPVLGYTKMHKGVDFAAPRGTPVFAAGDGVVERANRFSSFGNYVRIRHNDTYKTAYAHLKGFAKGIKAGARVKQGQVIAYVGTTGRSTGPHLHYEVHKNGVAVNPQSLDLPIGEKLKGTNLANFKNMVAKRQEEYTSLIK